MTLGETESKKCSRCGQTKPLSEFYKRYTTGEQRVSRCKSCTAEVRVLAYSPSKKREATLKRQYGITSQEYSALLDAQGGVCYICGKPCTTGRNLAVDHDHTTGYIRGLLCVNCNKYILGNLTLQKVEKIFEYLKNPPATLVFGSERKVPDGMEKPKRRRRKRSPKHKGT